MGDGGGADDRDGQLFTTAPPAYPACGDAPIVGHNQGNAQTLTNPLGKTHRIDVDGSNSANGRYGIPADNPFVGAAPGVVTEIWAFGLRNPFRLSFDTATGALLSGDAGQNDLEEVDQIVGGGNYGWSFKEGTMFFHHNSNQPGFASPCPTPPARRRPGCWTRSPSTTSTMKAMPSSAASSTAAARSPSCVATTSSATTRSCFRSPPGPTPSAACSTCGETSLRGHSGTAGV